MTIKGGHPTAEARERMHQSHLGKRHTFESTEKTRQANLGRHHTPESIEKMRRAKLGKHHTLEAKEKMSRTHNTPEVKRKHSECLKRLYEDPEFLKKKSKGLRSKTKPEKHLEKLLQSLYPNEFKYNGRYDCGISIDRMIPDFVNVNGRKQVIDMHGSYWHKGEDATVRQKRYAKYGYSSLIVWENELENEDKVVQKVVEFVGKEMIV